MLSKFLDWKWWVSSSNSKNNEYRWIYSLLNNTTASKKIQRDSPGEGKYDTWNILKFVEDSDYGNSNECSHLKNERRCHFRRNRKMKSIRELRQLFRFLCLKKCQWMVLYDTQIFKKSIDIRTSEFWLYMTKINFKWFFLMFVKQLQ